MNNFNEYFYIYKDSTGRWNEAKNPVFIAEHKACRAIKKSEVLKSFNNVLQLLNGLNDYFMLESDLNELQ